MNHSEQSKKLLKQEHAISKQCGITHLNSPSIFESSNSTIGMVIKLEGIPFDTENNETLNYQKDIWHRAISSLDENFCVYETIHRHRVNTEIKGDFGDIFSKELNEAYQDKFINRAMYVNDIYLTLVYKGVTSGKAAKGIGLLSKLTNRALKEARAITRRRQIKQLEDAVNQMCATLSKFKPRILGFNDEKLGCSELIQFLSLFVNGGETVRCKGIGYAPVLLKGLSNNKKNRNLYPEGNLSQYFTTKQILFGQYIQFQGAVESDCQFATMLSIKQYGNASASIMFDSLLHLDCEFIRTNTYAIEPSDIVLNTIEKQAARMASFDDPAKSEIEALDEAKNKVASRQLSMGYHHHTLMLISEDRKHLDKSITKAIRCYAESDFIAVKETLGQEPAFWAQIPTNMKYITRSGLVTSENFVDFAPLHNYRFGYRDGNFLGSAVSLLETPSKTPYFYNFHVAGSKTNPTKGHTIIVGGSGAGKTAFMTFMNSQLSRYQGNTFYFDRDRGAEIYIRAIGGTYSILSPNHPNETCFSPLQLNDTPANRQFNRDLLVQFCKENETEELSSDIVNQLMNCVNYAYDQLSEEHRTLTNATKILPIDFPKWSSLRRWLKGGGKNNDGEYAYIFDNENDQLQLQRKMGFDLTHFLDHEAMHIRTPVMMYLFHRLDLAILGESKDKSENTSGKLTSVWLDEGWQYLIDPYWKAKLERVLPTWRKNYAHLILGTQSPSSIVDSPIRNVIMDNIATEIYFCNPQAKESDYLSGLNLTITEYKVIKNNSPESRLFLVKQNNESTLCKLDLNCLQDKLAVLSGNSKTVNLLEKIRKEVGNDPLVWLPIFEERIQEIRA